MLRARKTASRFRGFSPPPEVIRIAAMTYFRCPLSLRNVEGLLFERGGRFGKTG